jgi:hypothetical protein
MLIKKQGWEVNDICSIKMITAEEIIGKIVDKGDGTITVSKPHVLQVQVDQRTGQAGMALIPTFVMGAGIDAKVTLKEMHIMCIVLADDDISQGYVRQTSSIAMPETGGIFT